jgi:hypothetical protein
MGDLAVAQVDQVSHGHPGARRLVDADRPRITAVMCEEAARTVHISRQLGTPLAIPGQDIDSLYDRYQHAYGQTGSR